MKVAHVNQDRGVAPGRKKGAAVHVEAMREAFARTGADVRGLDLPDPHALRTALDAYAPDLVYERYALGCSSAGSWAHVRGVPHVLEVNAPLALEETLYRGGAAPYDERELFGRATRVLAVSSATAEYSIERGARPDRVTVTPNAVDAERFRPRAAVDALRDELVPPGRFAVGFHGRLRPWHNFPFLVEALRRALEARVPVHLVALGEGDFEEHVRGALEADRASFLGWRPHEEAARVVATFDVLPLTYAPDAPCWFSPLKLLEAMACAVVPVVPDVGDLRETVEHGANGLVYRPGDLDGLVEALALLQHDPALHAHLGSAARRFALERSWVRIAQSVLALAGCAKGA